MINDKRMWLPVMRATEVFEERGVVTRITLANEQPTSTKRLREYDPADWEDGTCLCPECGIPLIEEINDGECLICPAIERRNETKETT